MSDIDQILSDEPLVEPVVEEAPQEVTQPRDETGKFTSKGDNGASPAQEEPELDHAALLGERRRRQEAEERARQLEEQIQQFQNPPAPPPDPFDEGYGQYVNASAAQVAAQTAARETRLLTSEMLLMQEVPNLSEIKESLMEFVDSNPAIDKQVAESGHPWKTAYQAFQNYQTMQKLGATNIDEMTAKIRAELEAEYAAKAPQIPNSLADAQSARNGTAPQAPPLSLADILSS